MADEQAQNEATIAAMHFSFDNAQDIIRAQHPNCTSTDVAYAMLISLVSSETGDNWYSFLEGALEESISQHIDSQEMRRKMMSPKLSLVSKNS